MKNHGLRFPDPRKSPGDAPLAVGGNLTEATLLQAYGMGIFPWYSAGSPILWWSPDPRFVLEPENLHIPHDLHRILAKPWHITADHAFAAVIKACAETPRPGQNGTWLTEEMREAYIRLHRSGFAHSIEVWSDGQLIGGLYGVALGRAFFGESMFYRQANASKVALVALVDFLQRKGYWFIDCQQPTEHLARFGASCWKRDRFLDYLEGALSEHTQPGSWAGESFSTRPADRP